MQDQIILFDGECHFCDRSVQFILKRDRHGYFKFASLQSELGQKLLKKHQIPTDTDSFVLVTSKQAYVKSTAALKVVRHLTGLWKILYIFILVPRPLRNFVYDVIAKNRYRWFGRKESCDLPTPEMRRRFLS